VRGQGLPLPIDQGVVLAEILEELRGISAKLDRGLAPIARADRELLAVLLPAISEALGTQRWTGAELFDHAQRNEAELLVALDAALGLDESAVRRLGKLFSRAHGVTLDGLLRIERHDEKRDGL
jgi:hypothetical protein